MAKVISGSDVMYAKSATAGVKPDAILKYIQAVETVLKIPFVQTTLTKIAMRFMGGENKAPAFSQNVLKTGTGTPQVTPQAAKPNNGGMSPRYIYDTLINSSDKIVNVAGDFSVREFFQQMKDYPDATMTIIAEGMKNADKPLELAEPKILSDGNPGKRKNSPKPKNSPAS